MSSPNAAATRVVPAQLATLSIYNPSLGATDETVREQILYYYSRSQRERKKATEEHGSKYETESEEEVNQRLRQIGLAQGMVAFAKNFSDGQPVDFVDTEKSRIVLHELERGWWILASIDLTRLPQPARETSSQVHLDYSAREVAPAQLLLQQLLRAHSIFLLHHASTLGELFQRLGRSAFGSLLEHYWTNFARSWDVILHGNPIMDIYNGIKLAVGGELGIGVGEEEWGSGEREVLEDFVARTEGLTDLVVARFGDAPEHLGGSSEAKVPPAKAKQLAPWLGTDADPRSSDGIIFSGTGAISRQSLATVSQWMEAIFRSGEDAYGVGDNPSSRHRAKRRKLATRKSSNRQAAAVKTTEARLRVKTRHAESDLRREAMERNAAPPGIPASLVPLVERSLDDAASHVEGDKASIPQPKASTGATDQESSLFDAEKMMGYLKFGYGSSWTLSSKGLPGNTIEEQASPSQGPDKTNEDVYNKTEDSRHSEPEIPQLQEVDPTPEFSDEDEAPFVQRLEQSIGKFIIGLSGDLENAEFGEDGQGEAEQGQEKTPQRLLLRTLTVELAQLTMGPRRYSNTSSTISPVPTDKPPTSAAASVDGTQSIINHQKLQVAVYVHQPFIFVFLFQLHTPSLTMPAFYRSIHHQLGPLQKPLLASTDPAKVAIRIADAMGESNSTTTPTTDDTTGQTIYDIIYDPARQTVRTSLPNIPIPGSLAAEGLSTAASSLTISGSWYTLGIPIGSTPSTPPREARSSMIKSDWTRVEALNVHTQMLNTWIATRDAAEVERTIKTGRGWWILWMQIASPGVGVKKEAFLVRKAAEQRGGVGGSINATRNRSGKWLLREQGREVSGGSVASSEQVTSSAGVSEGVGVDARRWVDGLLHLSR